MKKIVREALGLTASDSVLKRLEEEVLETDKALTPSRKQVNRTKFDSFQDPRLVLHGTLFNLQRSYDIQRAQAYRQLAKQLTEAASKVYQSYGIEKTEAVRGE